MMLDTNTVMEAVAETAARENENLANHIQERITEYKTTFELARAAAETEGSRMAVALAELERRQVAVKEQWEKDFAATLEDCENTDQIFREADEKLRSSLIDWHLATGDKTFDKHLQVRVTEKLEYELESATDWAKENAPYVLVADKKKFEAVAKTTKFPFVRYFPAYVAAIAKDFSK